MVLAGGMTLVLGCSTARPIQTDSAERAFGALSITVPHRILSEKDLRAGGRGYLLAVKGTLPSAAVSMPGYTEVDRDSGAQNLVVKLQGADVTPGRSGECSVMVYDG